MMPLKMEGKSPLLFVLWLHTLSVLEAKKDVSPRTTRELYLLIYSFVLVVSVITTTTTTTVSGV